MRKANVANTTHRSRLSARLRLSAVTALCVTFGAGAAFGGPADSLVAEVPPATDSAAGPFMSAPVEAPISQAIRELLARSDSLPAAASFEELTHLREFYATRNYEPLWVQGPGAFVQGDLLLATLRQFELRSPADLAPIITAIDLRRSSWAPAQVAELEWALSLALLRGAIDPSDPLASGPRANALTAVATAKNPLLTFGQWLPRDGDFWQLRAAVDEYQKIAASGGWPVGITGKAKEEFGLGARSEQIALLRQRLAVTGDYVAPVFVAGPVDPATVDPTGVEPAAGTPDPMVMDQALIDGVMRFQARHGLFADGVVGKMTLDALNVPVESRLRTMLINLRRLQLANRDYGSNFVLVNIAGQQMTLVQNGIVTMASDVIVGRDDRRTPEVDSAITRIEFNPVWYVPTRIQSVDLLPKIQNDSNFIASQGFRVYDSSTGQHVEPGSVNWSSDEAMSGRYKLRQSPGSANALGSAKFLFPNNHDVYLHGTNKPSLFAKQVRTLSSGCVRMPDAPRFAEAILRNDPSWDRARIDAVLEKGRNMSVKLVRPLPVHLVYQTAWMDDHGQMQFRNDIYGRDKRIAEEMKIALATP